MGNGLDFMDGKDSTTELAPEPAPEVASPPLEPDPELAAVEDEGVPASAPPAEPAREDRAVPITALLDERDRRQAAERERDELRRWRSEIEAAKAKPPDFHEAPDERFAYERQTVDQKLLNERLNISEMLARREHGDAAVDAAREAYFHAAQASPEMRQAALTKADPYGFVVGWHKRQTIIDEIGTDPEAWKARQRESMKDALKAEILAELQGAADPAPSRPKPPASLASAPAAGKSGEARPRGSAFDAAFGG